MESWQPRNVENLCEDFRRSTSATDKWTGSNPRAEPNPRRQTRRWVQMTRTNLPTHWQHKNPTQEVEAGSSRQPIGKSRPCDWPCSPLYLLLCVCCFSFISVPRVASARGTRLASIPVLEQVKLFQQFKFVSVKWRPIRWPFRRLPTDSGRNQIGF